MKFNLLVTALAALIPLVVGAVWYNPKVLGNAWKKTNGFDTEYKSKTKMIVIILVSFVFNFFLAATLTMLVIHQFGFFSTLNGVPGLTEPGSEAFNFAKQFMSNYGDNYRTFKHGVLHGVLFAFFAVLPIIGTHALYESKGVKYIAIHVGYWVVSLALMGGVICQFA